MFRNYLKTTFRNLWKNKTYSFLNIFGLAVGIACAALIFLWVEDELTYNHYFSNRDNLYNIKDQQTYDGTTLTFDATPGPLAQGIKTEIPGIKNTARCTWGDQLLFSVGDKNIYDQGNYVDAPFLTMFQLQFIKGNAATAFNQLYSLVVNETMAKKFFGTTDVVGKSLKVNNKQNYIITGVIKDLPKNVSFNFHWLAPFKIYEDNNTWLKDWGSNGVVTYVETEPNVNVNAINKKLHGYIQTKAPDAIAKMSIYPMNRWRLWNSFNDNGTEKEGRIKYVNLFSLIAWIILIIACINFMNLSTARSAERAKEVGVRKSIGAFRWQLSLQFITESVVLSLIAAVIAVLLVIIFLPAVNHLSQRELTFPLFTNWKLFLSLLTGAILLGMVTGIYPAFYLSSFRPAKVLKGSVQTGRNKSTIRNVLVVGQFACAIFLIIGTAFAVKQLHFMQNRPTGFDHDEVVNVRLQNGTSDKYDILKKDLLQNTLVKGVTASQDILGSHLDQSGIQFKGDGPLRQLTSTRLIVDPDYLKLYKIPLAAGRNFSSDKSANGKEYIINEKLAKELLKDDSSKAGIASLIGKQFGFDSLGYIVGIARDFNFNSLHNKIETMFLFNQKDWGYSNMSVKVNGNKEKEAIAFIGSVWKKACADTPFDYQFLDDHFDELYRSDSQISTIVGTLAILAIIISCLGLFGLASYAAERRTKEVGIRKTLGASLENLVLLLSKDFLKYVLIASLIALPLSWFSVHKWLQSYAYRVDISWWIFVLAVLVAMLIAFVTISFQAIKSAMANPVNSLRSE